MRRLCYKQRVAYSVVTVSIRSVRPLVQRLNALGHAVQPLLDAVGLEATVFSDGDARIPHHVAVELWQRAMKLSGDDTLGLHAAETLRPGAFDVLDYATRTSASLGEAWECLCRYHRLFHDAAVIKLTLTHELAQLTHELPPALPAVPLPIAEYILAGWLVASRQATGLELAAASVEFRHPEPRDVSEYRRVFAGPITWGADANRIALPRSLLATPLVKADAGLNEVLQRHVAEALARLPKATSFTLRVRELLAGQLSRGEPSATRIAGSLHMSARTLHRRLADERSSYHLLLDELRRELAVQHLSERSVAIAEVAFLLGFSEASAFHRAFKRWMGVTPSEYRRSLA